MGFREGRRAGIPRGWTQMPMVTPKSAAKPKAAPVQSGRIGQYARDLERVAEASDGS